MKSGVGKTQKNLSPFQGTQLNFDIYQRCNMAVCKPAGYNKATNDENWVAALKKEIFMIEKEKTWELVDQPQDRKVIRFKWVFRTKLNFDGSTKKHKVKLVVKGYTQNFCVDYFDTFVPVARLDTIKLLLSLAAQLGWKCTRWMSNRHF